MNQGLWTGGIRGFGWLRWFESGALMGWDGVHLWLGRPESVVVVVWDGVNKGVGCNGVTQVLQ